MIESLCNSLRRGAARLLIAAIAPFALASAHAQDTKIRFSLDWRFDGPSAIALQTKGKGYFTQEGLDVSIDTGTGSVSAIQRVAGGTHDIGIADTSALIEYLSNNPGSPRIQGVYMILEKLPASVFSLKSKGIKAPGDLVGKSMASPAFDAGRKAFPVFAKANNLDPSRVTWNSVDPALRETMLIKGEIDAITGFYYTSILNFEARGVKEADLNVMKYADYGVNLYGQMIIVSPKFMAENPKAVAGFLRALNRGIKDAVADPKAAIVYLKERDSLIDSALEERRLRLYLDNIATPTARRNGLGDVDKARLRANIVQVADAFGLKVYLDADQLFISTYLPPERDRKL